ncbi:SpoOM family protein [Haloprofundus marisrubri]|uniref:SpoOM family protein n=1 Tax=Haloprofundus marisrubri TaxID=1514971 RepID=A0A0W1R8I1_9EURY|nr:sporulation protein [Haloprofundus marisrubri]KTG09490.1 SpoOM family protein [Haloprofundus marisrubri]
MRNVLARIGIGSATVDTVLPSATVIPGQSVDAEVHIHGGASEQRVGQMVFAVKTRYRTEDGHETTTIDRLTLAEELTIAANQDEVRPVTLDIPYETPVTVGGIEVWIETELDIDWAVDPGDRDGLDVQPTPQMAALFDAMEQLGFSLHAADCEADPYGRYSAGRRFVQEFEYRPQSGPFAESLDEVELVCLPDSDGLTVYAEIDRRGGLLSELADTDERKTQFTVTDDDPDVILEQVRSAIEEQA